MISDATLAIAIGIVLLLIFVIVLLGRRPQRDAGMAALEERVGRVEHDMKNVRQVVNLLPTNTDFHQLSLQVAGTHGEVAGMKATLNTNSRQLDRIEDFLMQVSAEVLATGKAKTKSIGSSAGEG